MQLNLPGLSSIEPVPNGWERFIILAITQVMTGATPLRRLVKVNCSAEEGLAYQLNGILLKCPSNQYLRSERLMPLRRTVPW